MLLLSVYSIIVTASGIFKRDAVHSNDDADEDAFNFKEGF